MARVIKQAVSDIIRNHLQDPRIEGFVSITEVIISSDMKNADVHLSIMGCDEKKQKKTFIAINRAVGHIQSLIGKYVNARGCPHLTFHEDDRLKKTMETMNLISKVSEELKENSLEKPEEPSEQYD